MAYTAPDYPTARSDWETAIRALRIVSNQLANKQAALQTIQGQLSAIQDEIALRSQRVSETLSEMQRLVP
jgi:hypothetical protein